jgi:nitrogen regulatory protein PII
MTTKSTKITIVSEKLLQSKITDLIDEAGASGYTVIEGSGKGHHGVRSAARPNIVGAFGIVQIEVIVADRSVADAIADKVTATYFQDYSGIVFLEEVEILRPERF